MNSELADFESMPPISTSGYTRGSDFECSGNGKYSDLFRRIVYHSRPDSLGLSVKVSFFAEVAGSLASLPKSKSRFRCSLYKGLLLSVEYKIYWSEIYMKHDAFIIFYANLILESTQKLKEYAERKKLGQDFTQLEEFINQCIDTFLKEAPKLK